MGNSDTPFQIAILLYPGVTALDAVGPWEVLSRMPKTEVRFVGKEVGPLMTEGGALLLGVTHTVAETPSPDLVVVPGGTTTPGQMVDDEVLDWLRKEVQKLANEIMDQRMPADQRRLVPKIAWRRFIDLIRTGK